MTSSPSTPSAASRAPPPPPPIETTRRSGDRVGLGIIVLSSPIQSFSSPPESDRRRQFAEAVALREAGHIAVASQRRQSRPQRCVGRDFIFYFFTEFPSATLIRNSSEIKQTPSRCSVPCRPTRRRRRRGPRRRRRRRRPRCAASPVRRRG